MSWKKIEFLLANPWIHSFKRPVQIGFAAAAVTAAISIFMPNYYRSEVRILPVETKGSGGLGSLAAAAAAFGVGVPGGDGGDANYVDILNSRWMRENVLITKFTFGCRAWRMGDERKQTQTLMEYLGKKNLDQAIQAFVPMFSVSRDPKSKMLTLSVESKSPDLSQQVVKRASALLEEFVRENGRTRGGKKAAFAVARLEEARKEMSLAEDEFRRFLEVNRNYQVSADPLVRLGGLRLESELKLRQQLVMTLSLNREQALLEEKNDMPILNILDAGNLPIEKSGPARSGLVFLVSLLGALGGWGWLNRDWIKARLLENGDERGPHLTKENA